VGGKEAAGGDEYAGERAESVDVGAASQDAT